MFLAGDFRRLGTRGGGGVSSSTQVGTTATEDVWEELAALSEGSAILYAKRWYPLWD